MECEFKMSSYFTGTPWVYILGAGHFSRQKRSSTRFDYITQHALTSAAGQTPAIIFLIRALAKLGSARGETWSSTWFY